MFMQIVSVPQNIVAVRHKISHRTGEWNYIGRSFTACPRLALWEWANQNG